MCGFDYSDTEAAHLEEIYSGFEGTMSFEEEIAEAEYRRRNTIATLIGLDDDHHLTQRRRLKKRISANKGLFVIIQDSRKDGTTLMLVDRRKSKKYWWTHDFSLAYKGNKEDMEKVASKLKKNNVRVINYTEYFNS